MWTAGGSSFCGGADVDRLTKEVRPQYALPDNQLTSTYINNHIFPKLSNIGQNFIPSRPIIRNCPILDRTLSRAGRSLDIGFKNLLDSSEIRMNCFL